MKYVIILCDGMGDLPMEIHNNKTPMQVANKPGMDYLMSCGEYGLVQTIPDGMPAGSDTANLSVMGYDPSIYYSGRSPLEALSMGLDISTEDVTYRANLVTLSEDEPYENKTMVDYSSGEISTKESTELINYLADKLNTSKYNLYPGISYRHCLVSRNSHTGIKETPPHDILGKVVTEYLPSSPEHLQMMKKSYDLLLNHPINIARKQKGLNPASSLWLWGEGTKPKLTDFQTKTGLKGCVISAVDLIKGIGVASGMDVIEVPDVTGNINTNWEGKGQALLDNYKKYDFVYVHIEAPDECGHQGNYDLKVKSLELIDKHILSPFLKSVLDNKEDCSIMVLPDHRTPVQARTHTREPVPYTILRTNQAHPNKQMNFNEFTCEQGQYFPTASQLFDYFVQIKDRK